MKTTTKQDNEKLFNLRFVEIHHDNIWINLNEIKRRIWPELIQGETISGSPERTPHDCRIRVRRLSSSVSELKLLDDSEQSRRKIGEWMRFCVISERNEGFRRERLSGRKHCFFGFLFLFFKLKGWRHLYRIWTSKCEGKYSNNCRHLIKKKEIMSTDLTLINDTIQI